MKHWKDSVSRMKSSGMVLAAIVSGCLVFSALPSYAQSVVSILNLASRRAEQPVAPGSWVVASGVFTNVDLTVATSLPLPTALGGVTVTVEGVQAAIGSVSSSEVRFLIPSQTASGLRPVIVSGPNGAANGVVRVINAAPGIFRLGSDELPQAMVLNQDRSNNSQIRPALGGQIISIYATGPGALSQQIADGSAAPSTPAITTQGNVQVFVGGVECTVESSGLTPGFPSLWKVDVRIPQFAFLSGKLPVQVFMNGVDSNEVTIYVAQ